MHVERASGLKMQPNKFPRLVLFKQGSVVFKRDTCLHMATTPEFSCGLILGDDYVRSSFIVLVNGVFGDVLCSQVIDDIED